MSNLTLGSSARGNTSLESAVSLTKSLRWNIQTLGQRLSSMADEEDLARRGSPKAKSKVQNEIELKLVVAQIKKVLHQIEDAVPLINLAITTSGVNLSTNLPSTVSPSRLLQASTFLTASDTQYAMASSTSVQVGPTFTLSLYMLFSGHLRPQNEEDVRQSTWKEVIHKACVKLVRVPLESLNSPPQSMLEINLGGSLNSSRTESLGNKSEEYAYQLVIVEDFDDDRVHTFEDGDAQPGFYDGVEQSGIKEAIPIHEISKIFYADTGKILNICSDGEANNPILLIKRDLGAIPPRRMMEREEESNFGEIEDNSRSLVLSGANKHPDPSQALVDAQLEREHRASSVPVTEERVPSTKTWRIPSDLDPEWMAFEVYTEAEDSGTESDDELPSSEPVISRAASLDPQLTSALSDLQLNSNDSPASAPPMNQSIVRHSVSTPSYPAIRTSLSLLETMLRLISLQQFQQTSHLSIPDELLNFFLSESATTGAATGDEASRRHLRNEARRRVGFDPYDESPIKRRGEDYQYRGGESQAGRGWNGDEEQYPEYTNAGGWPEDERYGYSSPRYDEGYDTNRLPSDYAEGSRQIPETPFLLNNRPHSSSRSNTPDRFSSPSFRKSPSSNDARRFPSIIPRTPTAAGGDRRMGNLRNKNLGGMAGNRGSPLAKPGVEMIDEGARLSPSVVESTEKD